VTMRFPLIALVIDASPTTCRSLPTVATHTAPGASRA
jgi:hypothetical protein